MEKKNIAASNNDKSLPDSNCDVVNTKSVSSKRGGMRARSGSPPKVNEDEGRTRAKNVAVSADDGEEKQMQQTASMLPWILFLCTDCFMLVAINLVYSYAAFKLDLKAVMGWDEQALGLVWSLSNAGANLVVHVGLLYDRCGPRTTAVLAAVLQAVGLCGMAGLVLWRWNSPLLFGLCFLLDAQGMAAGIIMGQSEALRNSAPSRTGTALSVAKSAFGFGPVIWTGLYDTFFAPRVDMLFVCAAVAAVGSLATLIIMLQVVRSNLSGSATNAASKKKNVFPSVPKPALRSVLLSSDCAVVCGTVSVVTWGTALVWMSNIASFIVAAREDARAATIKSTFFTMSTVGRFLVGPLLDALPFQKETWVMLASATMVCSSVLMQITDGAALPVAAALAGVSFGADATLLPIMCSSISAPLQGTLYAIAKIAGLGVSTLWVWYGGREAQLHTAQGAANCVGASCYRNTWTFIVCVTMPAAACTAFWARKRATKQTKLE